MIEREILYKTKDMIRGFNAVDRSLIERAMNCNHDDWKIIYEEDTYNSTGLPSWGTLWEPVDVGINFDNEEDIKAVLECGFTIVIDYETDTSFVGIDGGGYDFIAEHFVPLYKKFYKQHPTKALINFLDK